MPQGTLWGFETSNFSNPHQTSWNANYTPFFPSLCFCGGYKFSALCTNENEDARHKVLIVSLGSCSASSSSCNPLGVQAFWTHVCAFCILLCHCPLSSVSHLWWSAHMSVTMTDFEFFGSSSAQILYFLRSAVVYTTSGLGKAQVPPYTGARQNFVAYPSWAKLRARREDKSQCCSTKGQGSGTISTPTWIGHWLKAGNQFPTLLSCVYRQC